MNTMIEILTKQVGLQNVYTPFPFKMHLIFCIVATVVYLTQFARKRSIHYLLIMLAIDATFITQINTSQIIITCLFILEVALLVAAGIFSHIYTKQQKLASEKKQTDENNNSMKE